MIYMYLSLLADYVGLPGADLLLNPIPILQKQIDGPISRLLQTVSALEEGGPLAEPIKLTIREIKFKDPLENSALPPLGDTNEPLSDFEVEPPPAEFQDSSRSELNLDGDTNVQAGSNVVVVDTTTDRESSSSPSPPPASEEAIILLTSPCSTPASTGDRVAEKEGDDRIPGLSNELKESSSSAVASADGDEERQPPLDVERCSNDLVQVEEVPVKGVTSCSVEAFQEEEEDTVTIDGLLLLNEHDQDHPSDKTVDEDDGKVQQAFEVELVEELQPGGGNGVLENSEPAIDAVNSPSVVGAPNTETEPQKDKSAADAESEVESAAAKKCDLVEEREGLQVNPEDAILVVVVPPIETASEKERVEDSLKIRQFTNCDNLVTRIASYYSNRDSSAAEEEEEDSQQQQDKRPPVPLKTYQWEDIKRAKQQGGYPWTHLNKPPLGPEDEPELLQRIRTLPKQRKRFEQKLLDSGSPKSQKRVRIYNEVLVQETEKYIQSLDDNNNDVTDSSEHLDKEPPEEEEEVVEEETIPSVADFLPLDTPRSPLTRKKSFRKGLRKLNPSRLLKRTPKTNANEETPQTTESPREETTPKPKSKILCHPIVVKLRELAKRQIKRSPSKTVKSHHLSPGDMEERQQILQLRESPKAGGREISAYIERHESDDVVEIVQLEESPGEVKRRKGHEVPTTAQTFVEPDEILALPVQEPMSNPLHEELPDEGIEPTISEILEEELRNDDPAPKKVARRQKEHYYEDIDPVDDDPNEHLNFTLMTPEMMHPAPPNIDLTLIGASGELIKTSLANQDDLLRTEMIAREKRLSDLFTQSSGEDEEAAGHQLSIAEGQTTSPKGFLLAPISSIDSASSEDERKVPLTPVTEESDRESMVISCEKDTNLQEEEEEEARKEDVLIPTGNILKDSVDDEHKQREADAHALVSSVLSTAVDVVNERWRDMSDHEYEPIGVPIEDYRRSPSPLTEQTRLSLSPHKTEEDEEQVSIQDIQDAIENRYFALTPTTTGSRTDCEVNTSAVDSSAIEDLPLDRGSRRRWNMGERGKQMQQRLKTGAGKLKTKFRSRSSEAKPVEDEEAIPKEKKKFKGPEFSKFKNMNPFQKKGASVDHAPRPTILVSDTTIEIDHKVPPKSSFASKFKSPDFSKIKERFSKSESTATTAVDGDEDVEVEKPKATSIFKKFEFKKNSEPVKPVDSVEEEEVQKMDTIKTPQETESHSSGSPITPEPPTTPDCYEAGVDLEEKEKPPKSSLFRAPDMSKFKDFKRPQFTKFEFKRPEFHRPKFSKPDMSRFKIPQRFHSLKLKRTKSLKETSGTASTTDSEAAEMKTDQPKKKTFEFGTYPRIFSKMRKGSTGAIPKSGRPSTPPPPMIFTTTATSDGTSNESRGDVDNESGMYQKYAADGTEYFDRETSVERRMREHFSKPMDTDSVDEVGILRETDEQRQINSFNEENRAIHEISHARRDEFQQRKPFVHQDSDLISEDSKWAQNMDDDKLAEQAMINRLLQHDIELQKQNDLDRRSIPQSNKDTISSGSASDRQRTNVIEEIDDDEFFLRSKGISQDNIRIGEYISSAIREGLAGQTVNSLKQVGGAGDDEYRYYDDEDDMPRNYGYDVPPSRPRRVKDSEERNRHVRNEDEDDVEEEYELRQDFDRALKAGEDDGYFTVGPNRPARRSSTQNNNRYASSELNADQRSYYDNDSEIVMMDDEEMGGPTGFSRMPPPTPPKVPKRKKKMATQMTRRIEKMDGFTGRSVSNSALMTTNTGDAADNLVVYRTEFEIPPIATPEKFTPVPTPRRTRSRSQISRLTDDDRTSRGAESLVSDAHDHHHQRNVLDLHKNGYAVIKKDPPPRPPAPLRRKRSTKSLGHDRQFNTMPHSSRKDVSPPPRPIRNYSTIVPSRPPRTKSISSLGEATRPNKSSPDVTEYEEIGAARNLHSGAVVNKMKDRPLPPPPRPDRTLPRRRKEQLKDPSEEQDDNQPGDDRDGGGERIVPVANESPQPTIDQQLSIEEMDISTQTEPLPDDFECEELDISPDMKTITPTQSKTLEDILKEEQEAEIERAQQQVAEQNLTRGLQRFRDANQRSISEKSWASKDRPKTPSMTHLSPHSSALRMNIQSFMDAEREEMPTLPALGVTPVGNQEPQEDNEINRNIEEELEKDNNDKILNLEVEDQPLQTEESATQSAPDQVLPSVESEIERQAQRLENIIDRLSEGSSPPPSPPLTTLPPIAPPRRKSSIEDPKLTSFANDLSSRLQLDVDRLNVNQLTAGNISAQDIQTTTITTNGGTGAANITQDVIDQITERILNSQQMQNRSNPQQPPSSGFFAIPTEYLNSLPPPSFYQLRDPEEKSDEKSVVEEKRSTTEADPKEGTSSSDPPSVLRLGGQFLNAAGAAFMRNVQEVLNMIPSSMAKEGEGGTTVTNRRDINVILLILIIIICCLLAFAMGGARTVHHHHWDFFNMPGSESLD